MPGFNVIISGPYMVEIDYNLPYNELIGVDPKKFDMVSNCFIPEHFPIEGSGIVATKMRYIEFSKFVETNEEVIDQIKGAGLRPAGTVHTAQFGIQQPQEQFDHPYIGLGSSWKAFNNCTFHPVLDRWTLRSYFGIVSVEEGGWNTGCRFLTLDE